MSELATTAQVAAELRVTFDQQAEAVCQRKLDELEGALRNRLNRPLVPTVVEGEVLNATPSGLLRLRWAPVISVEGITWSDGGTPQAVEGYSWERFGVIHSLAAVPAFTSPTQAVGPVFSVDYTAGLDGHNLPELGAAVIGAAARHMAKVLDHNVGATQVATEGTSVTYTPEGFTDNEWKAVRRHRRRV